MKRIAAGENKAKYDFSDPAYDKVRLKFLKLKIMNFFISVTTGIFYRLEARQKRKSTKQLKLRSKLNPRRMIRRTTKENLMKQVKKSLHLNKF